MKEHVMSTRKQLVANAPLKTLALALAGLLGLAFPAQAAVNTFMPNAAGNTSPGYTTFVWTNLNSTNLALIPEVLAPATNTTFDTLYATNNAGDFDGLFFFDTNVTGSIRMDCIAVGDDDGVTVSNFDPATWSGGLTSNTNVGLGGNSSGLGVGDSSGNAGIQSPGEAIIFQFDLDNLVVPTNTVELRMVGIEAHRNTWELWKRTGPASGTLVFSGDAGNEVNKFLEIVTNGATYAILADNARWETLTLDMREPPSTTDKPLGLSAVAIDSVVVLDWLDDETGFLDFYTVYRSTNSPVTTNDAAFSPVDTSDYLDTNVVNGTTYYYAVTAVDTNGPESALSAEVSATPVASSTDVVLYQWLEANSNDVLTVSGDVQTWFDQTGFFNDALDGPGSPVTFPSSTLSGSGLAGVQTTGTNQSTLQLFTGAASDAFLDYTPDGAAFTNSGHAALVAFTADSVTAARNPVLGNATSLGGGFGLRFVNDSGEMQAIVGGTSTTKGAATQFRILAGDTIVFGCTFSAPSGQYLFWDSKNNSTDTNNAPLLQDHSGDAVLLAGSGNSSQWFDGMVGEVKIYQSRLSYSQLVSEGQALATKWGATVPAYFPWAAGFGVGGPGDDDDGDGLENLGEYALGGNPTNALDVGMQPTISQVGDEVHYAYPIRSADPELIYQVETRPSMTSTNTPLWLELGFTPIATNVTGGAFDYITNSITGVDSTGTNTLSTLTNETYVRLEIRVQ
jgi:hypothetical protein